MRREFDPAKHCGAKNRQGLPCTNPLGFKTDHVGIGHCASHGGATITQRRAAAAQRVRNALAQMGQPVGTGDPYTLLSKTVAYAEGHLDATAAMVRELAASAAEQAEELSPALDLVAASDMLDMRIRTGARVGKAAADADIADRRDARDERMESLLYRFVRELMDQVVPKAKRAEIEAWASARFAQMAAEYDSGTAVN